MDRVLVAASSAASARIWQSPPRCLHQTSPSVARGGQGGFGGFGFGGNGGNSVSAAGVGSGGDGKGGAGGNGGAAGTAEGGGMFNLGSVAVTGNATTFASNQADGGAGGKWGALVEMATRVAAETTPMADRVAAAAMAWAELEAAALPDSRASVVASLTAEHLPARLHSPSLRTLR